MPPPPDESPSARADAQRNRERVLDAVFALSGDLRDLSLGEIARRAGVGRSTLYRHFSTREELLLAANRRAIEEGLVVARAVVAEGGTAAEMFTRLSVDIARLATRFRVLRADRELAARLLPDYVGDDPLMAWIVTAHAQGQLRQDLTPQWIMMMIVALALASADQLSVPGQDEERVAEMLAQTLIGAFVA